MVPKNYHKSREVTKNLGAEKISKSLFLGRYLHLLGIGIPKEDATENIFHIKAHLICSTSRSCVGSPLAQWSLSESVKENKEMRLGFRTDHSAYKTAEMKVLMVSLIEFKLAPLESAFNNNCHLPFSPLLINLYFPQILKAINSHYRTLGYLREKK